MSTKIAIDQELDLSIIRRGRPLCRPDWAEMELRPYVTLEDMVAKINKADLEIIVRKM